VDFEFIDEFIKVTDKDAAVMTRRLAKEEGLFVGWSCGSAAFGALEYAEKNLKDGDLMVVILPDHGTRYLNKIYNDNWMKDHGFLESRKFATAKDIISSKNGSSKLITIDAKTSVGEAIKVLNQVSISQIPVKDGDQFVGSLSDNSILGKLIEDPTIKDKAVKEVMEPAFKFVGMDNTIDVLSSLIDRENKALLVRDELNNVHIITQSDLLMAVTR
jgi:cystathionine beta-synthase